MKLLHQPSIRTKVIDLITNRSQGEKLSLYMKTYRVWQENEKSKIRLKNLVNESQMSLTNEKIINRLNDFLEEVRTDETFWYSMQEGLAIFASEKSFEYFILPTEFKELVYVSEKFNIKPLVPFLELDLEYYVLLLSQKRVKAFKGTNRYLEELDTSNVAKNIDEALWMDDPEKSIQHTSSKAVGPGSSGGSIYHGHGAYDDAKKENLRRFINKIDDDLNEVFKNKELPLILVTDAPNYAMFKEVTEYPNVYNRLISKNPDLLNIENIKDRIWNKVLDEYHDNRLKHVNRFKDALGTNLAIANVPEIVTNAFQQRIDTLFVDKEFTVFGRYDEQNNNVKIKEGVINGITNENLTNLVNFSIIHTLANGGRVFSIENGEFDDLDNEYKIAALLRF